MSDEVNPPARPRRLRLFALSAALLGGVVLGVVADRVYLAVIQSRPDARLFGTWNSSEGEHQFRPDGTYTLTPLVIRNGAITKGEPVNGRYRWVDRETIEEQESTDGKWAKWRLMFEGDQLVLLRYPGEVKYLHRGKD
jgi:hypothetical protein